MSSVTCIVGCSFHTSWNQYIGRKYLQSLKKIKTIQNNIYTSKEVRFGNSLPLKTLSSICLRRVQQSTRNLHSWAVSQYIVEKAPDQPWMPHPPAFPTPANFPLSCQNSHAYLRNTNPPGGSLNINQVVGKFP